MFNNDFSSRPFEIIPYMIAIVYDYKLKENYDDVHDHDQKSQNVLAAKLCLQIISATSYTCHTNVCKICQKSCTIRQ